MIATSPELNDALAREKALYLGNNGNKQKQMKKSLHKRYCIWRYMYYFRLCQYYRGVRQNGTAGRLERRIAKYKARRYEKKKNIWSYRSGVEIGIDSTIGEGCDIWHGGVVINGTVGRGCVFHGNNTVGVKATGSDGQTPVLGDRVDVGAGAVIIGGVRIADDCVIGAGAVVTKNFETPGTVIVGVPGKAICKQ